MATDEVMTRAVGGEIAAPSTELPADWVEQARMQAARIGRPVVGAPAAPPAPPQEDTGEIAWRYVDGHRVHPSWPPGHIEWLHEMQRTGELDLGDPDELRRAYENSQPE